jgi:ABC-type uncharacterized transport system ATPase subunit
MVKQLKIKVDDTANAVATLSGGNQKVIAKWLMTEVRIILLNDPTRGTTSAPSRRSISCSAISPITARPSFLYHRL